MDILNTQMNVESQPRENSGNIVERIQIPGEPFIIVGTEQTGYMVTFGKYQITKRLPSIQACKQKVESKDYEMLFALMGVAIAEQGTHNTINDTYKK